MTTFTTGRQAEIAASHYLKKKGYAVLDQNWRTRWCEIDIVAQKAKTIYFIEVKYRQSNAQGGGLEYITSRKLRQMRFAAELWVSEHRWTGSYQLAAVEVAADFVVTAFIDDLAS